MTEAEKDEYLSRRGWQKVNRIHWIHVDVSFRCKTDLAMLIEKKKDKESK